MKHCQGSVYWSSGPQSPFCLTLRMSYVPLKATIISMVVGRSLIHIFYNEKFIIPNENGLCKLSHKLFTKILMLPVSGQLTKCFPYLEILKVCGQLQQLKPESSNNVYDITLTSISAQPSSNRY